MKRTARDTSRFIQIVAGIFLVNFTYGSLISNIDSSNVTSCGILTTCYILPLAILCLTDSSSLLP